VWERTCERKNELKRKTTRDVKLVNEFMRIRIDTIVILLAREKKLCSV